MVFLIHRSVIGLLCQKYGIVEYLPRFLRKRPKKITELSSINIFNIGDFWVSIKFQAFYHILYSTLLPTSLMPTNSPTQWHPPLINGLKMNSDVVVLNSLESIGIGGVIWDHTGYSDRAQFFACWDGVWCDKYYLFNL